MRSDILLLAIMAPGIYCQSLLVSELSDGQPEVPVPTTAVKSSAASTSTQPVDQSTILPSMHVHSCQETTMVPSSYSAVPISTMTTPAESNIGYPTPPAYPTSYPEATTANGSAGSSSYPTVSRANTTFSSPTPSTTSMETPAGISTAQSTGGAAVMKPGVGFGAAGALLLAFL